MVLQSRSRLVFPSIRIAREDSWNGLDALGNSTFTSLISYPSPIITQSSFLAHNHNGHPGRAWFKLEESPMEHYSQKYHRSLTGAKASNPISSTPRGPRSLTDRSLEDH